MAGERAAGAMTFGASTGLTGVFEIHSKLQMQRRVEYVEHKARQSTGALRVSNVSLTRRSSPLIAFTTHDLNLTLLGGADKQSLGTVVFTQPAVGLSGANVNLTASFTTGILLKGDIKGGDAPNTEAEMEWFFYSTCGEPTWAEAT